MKTFCSQYVSNTLAASGNQSFFDSDSSAQLTGCVYYKLTRGGNFSYRFLYSDVIDTTFGEGDFSFANQHLGGWKIHLLKAAICSSAETSPCTSEMQTVLFDGNTFADIPSGGSVFSDDIMLSAGEGDFLYLEITFSGSRVPCFPEAIIPIYRRMEGEWKEDHRCPLPGLIGCSMPYDQRIAFLGDSITEGIGTTVNSYAHWCAQTALRLPSSHAYWNLGLGFARASDAARDGVWLQKAKENDWVNVCLGVNDLLHDTVQPAEAIMASLEKTVDVLLQNGCRVGLFTVPPFNYSKEIEKKWRIINAFILEQLSMKVDYVFDVVPIWGSGEGKEHICRYGGHPNAEGCRVLAESFSRFLKEKMNI